ncbi:Charged multivesicular body protein 3 [Schistosoma haematobium]|uniref:Charged multivesicular body protein 3 n=1 Tax=Schistosoma haematobium TaxID=6185 RepID=A0A094ZQS0_SCHHA|nr:Charged multivesicular body protein 3 [Schistosoma haematobium]KAH9595380.1 Charged multivesicular body protein 3 [Schistosoma haematobium]CAH8463989.1 unnamed protein product [Schistosoma haematobium]CAH8465301.1 unnamed protein product [Schistosoma haematobium]
MNLFGRKKDPKAQLNEMTSVLKRQKYPLQRDIQTHLRQQKQLEMAIRKCAKESDVPSAKVYAKEYAESKKAVARLYLALSQIDCVAMELRHMASMNKLTSGMQKSTTVMNAMSSLVKLPELQSTMQNLSKEMMKAGIMEEMISDTFEPIGSVENTDDLVSAEIDKVLWDLTAGQLGKAPEPAYDPFSVSKAQTELSVLSVQDDGEAEVDARLAALRS